MTTCATDICNVPATPPVDEFELGAVSIPQLVSQYAISRAAAYRLMRDGHLKFTQVNGRRLISRRSLLALLKSGQADPTT